MVVVTREEGVAQWSAAALGGARRRGRRRPAELRLDAPLRRRGDCQPMLLAAQPFDEHEQIRAVEVRLVLVEKTRARIEHARVIAIAHLYGLPRARVDAPRALVVLPHPMLARAPLAHVRRIVLQQ